MFVHFLGFEKVNYETYEPKVNFSEGCSTAHNMNFFESFLHWIPFLYLMCTLHHIELQWKLFVPWSLNFFILHILVILSFKVI